MNYVNSIPISMLRQHIKLKGNELKRADVDGNGSMFQIVSGNVCMELYRVLCKFIEF